MFGLFAAASGMWGMNLLSFQTVAYLLNVTAQGMQTGSGGVRTDVCFDSMEQLGPGSVKTQRGS